ncbi:hypothetical protein CYMTET_27701 [Cymbomonas tetramitiformis]|uniref:Uncharacterized protein n=1 Tax=Cymbomonas tetramitiformis TaxID=36881 RepID=A0AAE0KWM4_9CHLO|nr:hypothetical protein CYMTET_27701 [Cymbomonas tetramitiformis]
MARLQEHGVETPEQPLARLQGAELLARPLVQPSAQPLAQRLVHVAEPLIRGVEMLAQGKKLPAQPQENGAAPLTQPLVLDEELLAQLLVQPLAQPPVDGA